MRLCDRDLRCADMPRGLVRWFVCLLACIPVAFQAEGMIRRFSLEATVTCSRFVAIFEYKLVYVSVHQTNF